ncbi:MAG TPA: hypothetical protein VK724_17585 [Bryobacteraceae bacterium]|jgi:hypothetical protein|nr:hypothetical protein [Bryobacteraceae bacterium]
MRTITLSSLLLVFGFLGLAQNPADQDDKAPPAVEEALRARVGQYYQAFMAGKFKDAYNLVADDSQDAFLVADKDQYKSCETLKIRYSENFKKATVLESCKTDWVWHGVRTPTTFPITSTWKVVDDKWFWFYVRPTQAPFPFSPTGFIPVPSEEEMAKATAIPRDMQGAAKNILSKITLDKKSVHLLPDQTSHDVIQIHNGMPGEIKLEMDQLAIPGLKTTLGKSTLIANEDTTLTFEYNLESTDIACIDCAKKIKGTPFVALHVIPTGQIFNISIYFGPAGPVTYHKVPAPAQ